MCGRYAASKDVDGLVEQFAVAEVVEAPPAPNYNVAPTDNVPMVVEAEQGGSRQLRVARWGLVPSWAKDVKVGARMFNARWESLADKPAFRVPFAKRRCLLPADGYFEWYRLATQGPGKPAKQPYFIHPVEGGSLALAGLFDFWRPTPDSPWVVSAAVVTTAATGPLAAIHDRMPVMVPREQFGAWLARGEPFPGPVPELPEAALALYPVSCEVNSVRNKGPQLLAAIPAADLPPGAPVGAA